MNARELQAAADSVGLDAVGAARVGPYESTEAAIRDRSERGLFADMSFTMSRPEVSCHPERLLPGAQTVVSGAMGYYTVGPSPRAGQAALPRYTWVDAYSPLRTALAELGKRIGGSFRVLVDENDHVDREAAARSGVGFYGKNTMIITPEHGSWVVLGALITDVAVESTDPLELDCAECRLCIDACPTGALDEPGELDATKCLSYWTQSRRAIPDEYREELAGQAYGCDICQDVCPWNRPAEKRAQGHAPRPDAEAHVDLREWLTVSDEELGARYERLYFPRNDPRFLRRNAIVAAGAGAERELTGLVEAFAAGDDEFLAEHAGWALTRLEKS